MKRVIIAFVISAALVISAQAEGVFVSGDRTLVIWGQTLGELPNILELGREANAPSCLIMPRDNNAYLAECPEGNLPFEYVLEDGVISAVLIDGRRFTRE